AKGCCQSLLQYLLISLDIVDIATRNLSRRLQKKIGYHAIRDSQSFCILEYQSPYIEIYCDNPRIFDD
ncbi:hypothetical protein, partial [Bifidobacterium pseudocatenulatum]|uniref:hypothetical protein n=1 Tax=Bifidobacterium pseudocatenulatum TaxID=28026 RepID=UPI001CF93322